MAIAACGHCADTRLSLWRLVREVQINERPAFQGVCQCGKRTLFFGTPEAAKRALDLIDGRHSWRL